MPKQFSSLDYQVPKELESVIQVGQLVRIELRRSHVFGIVLSIQTNAEFSGKIKPLTEIIQSSPLLNERQLHIYRIVARWYSVALPTLLKQALLPQQKRKIQTEDLFTLLPNHTIKTKPSLDSIPYTTPQEFISFIQNKLHSLQPSEQLLILCPLQNRADELAATLQAKKIESVVWNGRLSVKQQFERWLQVRNGQAQVIVGTRSASLLAFYQLGAIIIDQYHHDGHKQFEQLPLIDSRDIARLLSDVYGISVAATVPQLPAQAKLPTIIDMRGEQAGGEYSLISHRVQEELQTLQGDACFWLNRRGYASSYSCQSCGFISSCPKCALPFVYHRRLNQLRCNHCHTQGTIFTACPSCNENMLKLRGSGSELLGEELRKLKKELQLPHDIIGIDSDVDESERLEHRNPDIPILLYGTQKMLPYVDIEKNQLFVILKANTQLAIPEYSAEHEFYQKIQWIRFFQSPHSRLIIQSMNPEHPLYSDLSNPKQFQERMYAQRKALKYPPFFYLTRYLFQAKSKKTAQQTAESLHQSLQSLLTQEKKSLTISHPYALQPQYYRGGYWYAILVRFPVDSWKNDLLWLNRYIPSSWRVDPNPRSIFSVS